jgi:cell fate (sporulation/competence/biofilm development) regulator YlbF (YheA/YmcA/DUF963 family)
MRLLTSPTSAPRLAITGLKEGKKRADEAVRKATKPAREAITKEAEAMADEGDVMKATALQSMSDLFIPEDALGAAMTAAPGAGAIAKMAPKAKAAMKMRRGMATIPFDPKGPRGKGRLRVAGDPEEAISMVLGKDEGKKVFEDLLDKISVGMPQAPGFIGRRFTDEQQALINILDDAGKARIQRQYDRNARALVRENEKAKKIRAAIDRNQQKVRRIEESGMRGPTIDEEKLKLKMELRELIEQDKKVSSFQLRLSEEATRLENMDAARLDGLMEGAEHADMVLRIQGKGAAPGDPKFASMNEVISFLAEDSGRTANEVRKAFLDYLGAME